MSRSATGALKNAGMELFDKESYAYALGVFERGFKSR
jgi:hypothetical protein